MSRVTTIVAILSLAAMTLGNPSQAQDAVAAAWRMECTGDGKILDCRAVQQLFNRESGKLLITVLVRRPDPKTTQMTVQIPLGLNLTEPIQMKVDDSPPERLPIQTCTTIGCFGSTPINEKQLAAMRGGTALKITVHDSNRKPIEVPLPLLGFGLAYDKLR
jgi:invasion protein IalB